MTGRELRKGERIQPFLAPCRVIHEERRFAAHLIELSLGGGRVACRALPPPAGAAVVLEVRFEAGAERIVAEAIEQFRLRAATLS